jgi:SAM-dependent methyltransferase
MIAVARSLPVPAGAPIEWLVRSALDLGLEDAGFDAVLCQQGLQFFPDKLLALREIRRVLRPGGRLALSTWNSNGPYNSAVGDALASLIGGATAARFCASRQAPGAEELRRLAAEADLVAVDVRVCRIDVHLPPPDRFALDHLAATPVAAEIAAADPDVLHQIAARVLHALQPYADGDGVTYPEETHVLTAQRS